MSNRKRREFLIYSSRTQDRSSKIRQNPKATLFNRRKAINIRNKEQKPESSQQMEEKAFKQIPTQFCN